ncbi:MAG: hypothetical protein VYA39_01095 [Candidatus Thermoplasmatota archaeon]|nr:hypothetical protein [Candidatus Thermoplasmatota archaeon]
MSAPRHTWWADPMVWIGLLQGGAIWLVMAVYLSVTAAWISLACGGLIGFFLYLVALGYEDYRFAKATVWGVLINAALSSLSAFLSFI